MADTRLTSAAWKAAVWSAHKQGRLTRSARDVMLTLATFGSRRGRIWPSHALLAERVACSVKTVARAMQQARAAGLLRWKAIRWKTRQGVWLRKSNAYDLRTPPVDNPAPYIGLFVGEGEKKIKRKEEGSGRRSVAQQLAALGMGSVVDARKALAKAAERMLARQRAALVR